MQGGKGVLFMKKLLNNLPFRLLLGIVIGIILGQVFPLSFMRVVVTLQYIMGQLITFCVPLIIIGFIAPSITKLGKNASRLLERSNPNPNHCPLGHLWRRFHRK